jgi:hypothetical protein
MKGGKRLLQKLEVRVSRNCLLQNSYWTKQFLSYVWLPGKTSHKVKI